MTFLIRDAPGSDNVTQMGTSVFDLSKVAHLQRVAVRHCVKKRLPEPDRTALDDL
jgi:hypothetical protein